MWQCEIRSTHHTPIVFVSHQLGITLGQCPVSEKTNEIPIARQILRAFDVAGKDVLFDEDASQVRCGNIPQVMAALRDTTISLLRTSGNTEIASAFRYFAANPKEALTIIGANIDN